MRSFNVRRALIVSTSILALGGCGADDIASPGTGGNVTITYPAPTPAPSPTPTPVATLVTPATGCPTIADPQGLVDKGTITGPTGTYRVCDLPAVINASVRLAKVPGLLYELPGRVDVGTDRGAASTGYNTVLTIDPGVIVFGGTGVSWLAVNRGNQIQAVGTATAPIIFTSRDNILGLNNDNSSGQWGGVVLMGRAPVTDCRVAAAPGSVDCERDTEGSSSVARYGGIQTTDNSGRMSYVQIRYSGYVLGANSELQSLTTEGIGSATQLDHIMSFNSSDDGAEFFGGRVNMKYFVSVGAEDDNLDTDTGVKANFQYVLVAQRPTVGDAIIEADSDNTAETDNPRQNTRVANFTFLYRSPGGPDAAAILLRGGTDYTLVNGVLASPNYACLNISRPQTIATAADPSIDEAGAPVFRSVLFQCGSPKYVGTSGVTAAQTQAAFGAGANGNSDTYMPTLANLFINGATEAAATVFDASTLNTGGSTFFDKTSYIGAVRDANDTWYKGWTCDSSTANFGSGTSCTSLPTT